jgi:hypothetical protein
MSAVGVKQLQGSEGKGTYDSAGIFSTVFFHGIPQGCNTYERITWNVFRESHSFYRDPVERRNSNKLDCYA